MPKSKHLDDLVEIDLPKPEMFLILKETLTRIGVPNREGTKLFQTCHILCKKKHYYITHFKELFLLDGLPSNLTVSDVARRNSIINFLVEKKLCTLTTGDAHLEPYLPSTEENKPFTFVPHAEKKKWELVPKYVIGNPKNRVKAKKTAAVSSTSES